MQKNIKIKTILIATICFYILLSCSTKTNVNALGMTITDVEQGFKNPLGSSKPWTWYHWLNGRS
jgi:hypothetical protein